MRHVACQAVSRRKGETLTQGYDYLVCRGTPVSHTSGVRR